MTKKDSGCEWGSPQSLVALTTDLFYPLVDPAALGSIDLGATDIMHFEINVAGGMFSTGILFAHAIDLRAVAYAIGSGLPWRIGKWSMHSDAMCNELYRDQFVEFTLDQLSEASPDADEILCRFKRMCDIDYEAYDCSNRSHVVGFGEMWGFDEEGNEVDIIRELFNAHSDITWLECLENMARHRRQKNLRELIKAPQS